MHLQQYRIAQRVHMLHAWIVRGSSHLRFREKPNAISNICIYQWCHCMRAFECTLTIILLEILANEQFHG